MEDGKSRSCGVASSSGGGWSGTAVVLGKEEEATVAEMGGSFLSFYPFLSATLQPHHGLRMGTPWNVVLAH